jgi:Holliday junction DNA helicase RuvA
MIAKLAGVVEQIEPDAAVIDVGGVGYLAFCSTRSVASRRRGPRRGC